MFGFLTETGGIIKLTHKSQDVKLFNYLSTHLVQPLGMLTLDKLVGLSSVSSFFVNRLNK
jgi:hypothetical protein